ncbi:hypothetical protein QAD02_015611 [Eretmocerus hayati]|uniref:Uncharacterized protein n=1 Tax=Eretmocerus hayati TaxID=131215 RepID=A0ACC2P884_9HYME|nr:hypothetical protein QAD02_015611 [Eretmocerus hayati]
MNILIVGADSTTGYREFFENFLLPNKPCIFDTSVTKDWPCRETWTLNDAPHFEWLKDHFGDCKVPVANCNKRYYNAQQKDEMSFNSYLDYWIDFRNNNYSNEMPLLYLKDWHCTKSFPSTSIYYVPPYFASDWLNEYYLNNPNLEDDYMFVYMGPKGTWTPLHADVFTSYSWSFNVVGKKRWLLFPPGQEDCLRNINGNLVYDVMSMDSNKIMEYDQSNNKIVKIDIVQESGEIIFVPSGWHHQVWNLEDTISINHNWLNGCTILNVWSSLQRELTAVMKEIKDCMDMEDWAMHCQIMLKASFGMDYFQYYELLSFIAEKRINSVINNVPVVTFERWQLGKNHCLFDLQRIKSALELLINDAQEREISSLLWENNQAHVLLQKVNEVLIV